MLDFEGGGGVKFVKRLKNAVTYEATLTAATRSSSDIDFGFIYNREVSLSVGVNHSYRRVGALKLNSSRGSLSLQC